MFQEKYRRDNEKIVADESLKRYIKVKMREGEGTKRFPAAAGVLSAALCVCVVLSAVFIIKDRLPAGVTVPQTAEAQVLTSGLTYDEIYASVDRVLAKSRPTLGDRLSAIFFNSKNSYAAPEGDFYMDAEDGTAAVTEASGAGVSGADRSETNNQVEGVDEADIVKTDGSYIYSVTGNRLVIASAADGRLEKLSDTKLPDEWNVCEFFLYGDKVFLYLYDYTDGAGESTKILIYSVADRARPQLITTLSQSGGYFTARMTDGVIYTVSNQYIYDEALKKNDRTTYIPSVAENGEETVFETSCISVLENFETAKYLVVTAIDADTAEFISKQAILGGAENVYCNQNSLIFTFTEQVGFTEGSSSEADSVQSYSSRSCIVRLSLDGEIKTAATGTVDGTPLNQFSIDEYNGYVRIVTTVEKTTVSKEGAASFSQSDTVNALYVLDSDLKVVGSIENLAEGERVYSVRFDGNIGYFVTFRQIDPLFTVDLTDPSAPTLLSELKIPGFSDYLHVWKDGLLFGFGRSATDTGAVTGLKLSMFDVSDPADVTEKSVLELQAATSEANYNHKAIMVNSGKNIIAFTAESVSGNTLISTLYVYGYDGENGFYERSSSAVGESFYNARFVYIGDYFYLITPSRIISYSMSDFAQTDQISF